MVVKKQLRKISKKIMILGLATSIIFTSCFSTKKIDAHATSVVAGLGAYTLYEICLYIGGLAVTALGIGYAYENRDDIAEFGKSVIDSMTDLPIQGWILGSSTVHGDYVYGTEALQEVQGTEWTVIQGGGQSPKNDNDDDGDEDLDDREIELNLNSYFLTSAGVSLFENHIKPIYDAWVNKEEGNILDEYYYPVDQLWFDGTLPKNGSKYIGTVYYNGNVYELTCAKPMFVIWCPTGTAIRSIQTGLDPNVSINGGAVKENYQVTFSYNKTAVCPSTNLPVFDNLNSRDKYVSNISNTQDAINYRKSYQVADWLADNDYWKGFLEDIATSLRSLQGLSNIAQEFAQNILEYKPTVNIAGDTLNEYANYTYAPVTNVFITQPTYYPATNTTPKLDISVFPNYDIYIQNGGGGELPPDDGDGDDNSGDNNSNFDIDLPTLSIMFDIIYLMVMIVVMLLFVFLACLGFIVMIFRIPASSNMLPEDMVLGFEHLKTIMIPGFNISIFDFAMALIYLFIVFTVIKIIRLEINDYGIPKSRKGG